MEEDDDDEEIYGGLYEDGHWEWCNAEGALTFKSDLPPKTEYSTHHTPIVIGSLDFRDDLDVMEQQRFRKRFQRKPTEDDVVTLQDIKDLVLFTAPKNILTPSIINVLHLPKTERFMRALIAYCQYYLQVLDAMHTRTAELEVKIHTLKSDEIESTFCENLQDFRLLVAKEYCAIVMGAGDFSKYHHMGSLKKSRSMSKKESILFESILRISTQVVWLALGRKSYSQIELEIHRIFKSDTYNIVEHTLDAKNRQRLDFQEQSVLFGNCLRQWRMCNMHSPLWAEAYCHRNIDYRLMGLGVIKFERLNPRLRYFERVLIAPENTLRQNGVTIGILGLPRTWFDIVLKEIKMPVTTSTSNQSVKHSQSKTTSSKTSRASRQSTASRKSTVVALPPLFNADIYIPEKEDSTLCIPDRFPSTDQHRKSCNEDQHKKWLAHVHRLNGKRKCTKMKKKIK